MSARRIVLVALGALVVIVGFVVMAHSGGRLDRLVAFLVIFTGFAVVVLTTAGPSRAALARSWDEDEDEEQ